jgi:PHD/YefM family antitoxin component YafN of YafNO toxin-antitoxin module
MKNDTTYERIGIRELRKDLSNTLSNVDRNRQRVVIGRNSDEIAALVPLSDLKRLDALDEQQAEQCEEETYSIESVHSYKGEVMSTDTMFAGFSEKSANRDRYEDETEEELVNQIETTYPLEDLEVAIPEFAHVSAVSALQGLSSDKQRVFMEIYEMIDEAVFNGGEHGAEMRAAIGAIRNRLKFAHLQPMYSTGVDVTTIPGTRFKKNVSATSTRVALLRRLAEDVSINTEHSEATIIAQNPLLKK